MASIVNIIANILLPTLSLGAVYLSQARTFRARRWASVLGLCSEPFWMYMGVHTSQWGVLVLAVFFTVSWGKGFYNYWIKPNASN